ncbi:Ig-like domain-containing protein [Streptomyces polyrhachis]|uniref:Ig-like domain-containing protein n=1 Tax=Streptomyces polyrhachis TaxID=1282885 RepID=A0ABW2G949_9ACTN
MNTPRTHRTPRRSLLAAVALAAGSALLLSACGGTDEAAGSAHQQLAGGKSEEGGKAGKPAEPESAPDSVITVTPEDGARNVGINRGTKVTVAKGTLTGVVLKDAAGTEVPGTVAADGRSWAPDSALRRGTDYSLVAKAKDGRGRISTSHSDFSTVSAAGSFIGHFQSDIEGATVGGGMYPSITFDKPVVNKALVESRITASASSGQRLVGHWFGDRRLDLRPQTYFAPGTRVTFHLDLDGVEASPGVVGVQDRWVSYTVGRTQVSTVDVAARTMTVVRDGVVVKTVPISAGSAENPTYNGTMTISEKFKETRMDGSTVGFVDDKGESDYDIADVPHAMRLSTSGTFIHGNYWGGKDVFGNVNTSHGCVGLRDVQGAGDASTPGAWFYENSLIGDLVVVKNSPDRTISPDNGINGWSMDWAAWTAGSAL